MFKTDLKERIVKMGHERTQRAVSAAQGRADNTLQRLSEQISRNEDTCNSFFDARRHIDEAAYHNAQEHEINL